MTWKTIISFTDNNKPYRFKVATFPSGDGATKDWYIVQVEEIDEYDKTKDNFDFRLNVNDSSFKPVTTVKPILLISELMIEEVRKGNEKWD